MLIGSGEEDLADTNPATVLEAAAIQGDTSTAAVIASADIAATTVIVTPVGTTPQSPVPEAPVPKAPVPEVPVPLPTAKVPKIIVIEPEGRQRMCS